MSVRYTAHYVKAMTNLQFTLIQIQDKSAHHTLRTAENLMDQFICLQIIENCD